MSLFFSLPYELRQIVYRHYFSSDGGYLYNPDSGRLTCASRQPVDLSIRYTCRNIADETRHLPLRYNAIVFRSGGPWMVLQRKLPPQDLWRSRPYPWTRHDPSSEDTEPRLRRDQQFRHGFELGSLFEYREFITADVIDQANCKFPTLKPFLDYVLDGSIHHEIMPYDPWYIQRNGESPSLMMRWRDYIMQTAARSHPLVPELAVYRDCFDSHHLLHPTPDMVQRHDEYPHSENGPIWLLPTICSAKYRRHPNPGPLPDHYPLTTSAHRLDFIALGGNLLCDDAINEPAVYSAAALAISFLISLEKLDRLSIRHIMVHECTESFAAPARHGQGLIPFCLENPCLLIDRVVDVFGILRWSGRGRFTYRRFTRVEVISAALALWLVEADQLFALGMPRSSFRFTFDGGSRPDVATQVFQTVMQRDCAWQVAFDRIFASAPPTRATFWSRRRHNCCVYDEFPRLMARLCDPDDVSFKCNFDPGVVWHEPLLSQASQHWTLLDWHTHWRHRPEYKVDKEEFSPGSLFLFDSEIPGCDNRMGYMNNFPFHSAFFEPTMPH